MDKDTDKGEDENMDMKVNQAKAMSSVEGGRSYEEQSQSEKKPQGKGQWSESEDSSEEDKYDLKKFVIEEVFENEEIIYLDKEDKEDKREELADDHDFRKAFYSIDRNHMYEMYLSTRNKSVFEKPVHGDIPDDTRKEGVTELIGAL